MHFYIRAKRIKCSEKIVCDDDDRHFENWSEVSTRVK